MNYKTPLEKLQSYVPELPSRRSWLVSKLITAAFQFFRPAEFIFDSDADRLKGKQVMILAAHASADDPLHIFYGYPFRRLNAVMGTQNIIRKGLFRLFLENGVIPKKLYVPDLRTVKNILRIIKKGGSVLLFPEGIQSMDGSSHSLRPGTAALVKKAGLDTVLCTSRGSYLSRPRYDKHFRRGRLEYHFELLFSGEDLTKLPEEEIASELEKRLQFNDFKWNAEKQCEYKSKVSLAEGIDRILFICPKCGRQFSMHTEGSRLKCSCGNSIEIDSRYNLIPDEGSSLPFRRIDEWYKWQEEIIKAEVMKEDFRMEYEAEYRAMAGTGRRIEAFPAVGEGRVGLDRHSLC